MVKLSNIVSLNGVYESFKPELGNLAKTLGIKIYPQLTNVHRIFRMPGTISSSSGLVKLRYDDRESFDPRYDSRILGGRKVEDETKLSSQISLKIRGQSFKIKEDFIKVPLFVAVYLICKGLGEATI